VNTVVDGRLGYNTDGVGFLLSLKEEGISVSGKKILVLGGGGSGRSTAAALKSAGADVYMYQRNRHNLLEVCEQLGLTPIDNPEQGDFDILINTTGVGMHDTEGLSPVSEKAFLGAEMAIDLIYAPTQSKFCVWQRREGFARSTGKVCSFIKGIMPIAYTWGLSPTRRRR
jgi:shikimate dehydrogenase